MSRCSPRNMPLARSPFSLLLHSRCRTYKPPFPPRYPHPSPSYLLERTTRPPSWLVPSTLPLPSALTPSTSIPHLPPPTPPCPCLPLYKKDLSAPGLSRQGEHDGGLRASRAPPAPCDSGGRRTPKPLPARPRSRRPVSPPAGLAQLPNGHHPLQHAPWRPSSPPSAWPGPRTCSCSTSSGPASSSPRTDTSGREAWCVGPSLDHLPQPHQPHSPNPPLALPPACLARLTDTHHCLGRL